MDRGVPESGVAAKRTDISSPDGLRAAGSGGDPTLVAALRWTSAGVADLRLCRRIVHRRQ
jgi:hypothetical protein